MKRGPWATAEDPTGDRPGEPGPLTVRLTRRQSDDVRAIAAETDRSVASVVEIALSIGLPEVDFEHRQPRSEAAL